MPLKPPDTSHTDGEALVFVPSDHNISSTGHVPKSFLRFDYTLNDTIQLNRSINGVLQCFYIHRHLLSSTSTYFRRYFEEKQPIIKFKIVPVLNYHNELDFIDGTKTDAESHATTSYKEEGEVELAIRIKLPANSIYRTISLPTGLDIVDADTFKLFVDWVYYTTNGPAASNMKIDARSAAKLWILAGRLGVPACQNALIVALEHLRKKSGITQTAMLRWIYQNTREYPFGRCGLRNLLVDQCSLLDKGWLERECNSGKNKAQLPKRLLLEHFARGLNREQAGAALRGVEYGDKRYWVDENGLTAAQ